MAVFGVSQSEFEQFKARMDGAIAELHQAIRQKVTDSEEAARASATNAKAQEESVRATASRVQAALTELESYKTGALQELQATQQERAKVIAELTNQQTQIATVISSYQQFVEQKKIVDSQVGDIAAKVEQTNNLVAQAKPLPELVAQTQKALAEAKGTAESINNILTHATTKKSEIDELHKKILGEDIKTTDGKTEHVNGTKDDLEKAYTDLSARVPFLELEINGLLQVLTQKNDAVQSQQIADFSNLVEQSKSRFKAVSDQLDSLLPGSMAAGLSAAYEQKKSDESKSLQKFEVIFGIAIALMVLVSLIPFGVDIYLLTVQGKNIVQVMKDAPNLLVSILPLYFPVLWLAYSTNKKVNLSKRLIEEYTHKAVLGKTFSGLSTQIEALPHQDDVKDELRTRLLFNVLQVSAENPGKLITDYNKADHPLMEALEKSTKLSDAVDALSKIPGLSSLLTKVSERSATLLAKQADKVERGLEVAASLEQVGEATGEAKKA